MFRLTRSPLSLAGERTDDVTLGQMTLTINKPRRTDECGPRSRIIQHLMFSLCRCFPSLLHYSLPLRIFFCSFSKMTRLGLRAIVIACIATVMLTTQGIAALHEDEVGKFDWYYRGVGVASLGVFGPRSKSSKRLFLATEDNVLAALSRKSPDVRWRHAFGRNDTLACLTHSGASAVAPDTAPGRAVVLAVSTNGIAQTFDAESGSLLETLSVALKPGSIAVACALAAEGYAVVAFRTSPSSGDSEASTVGTDTVDLVKVMFSAKSILPVAEAQSVSGVPRTSASWTMTGSGHLFAVAGGDVLVIVNGPSSLLVFQSPLAAACSPASSDGDAASVVFADDDHVTIGGTSGKGYCRFRATPSGLVPLEDAAGEATEGVIVLTAAPHSTSVDAINGVVTFADGKTATFEAFGAVRVLAFRGDAERVELILRTGDGHVHLFDRASSHSTVTQWSRPDGVSAAVDACFGDSFMPKSDPFGQSQRIFVLSKFGRLYGMSTAAVPSTSASNVSSGNPVAWHVAITFPAGTNARSIARSRFESCTGEKLRIRIGSHESRAIPHLTRFIELHTADGTAAAPGAALGVNGAITFTIDEVKGQLVGYRTAHLAPTATASAEPSPAWRVDIGFPFVAVAADHNPYAVAVVEHLRNFPNATLKANEVRRKYPMANVIVVAYFVPPALSAIDEDSADGDDAADADQHHRRGASSSSSSSDFPILVLTAIDATSGGVLATMQHVDVEGPIHLLVAEHMLVYHMFNVRKGKYYVGVWELFEHQDVFSADNALTSPALIVTSFISKRRKFTSMAQRSPMVSSQLLAFPSGAITGLSVTVTKHGIARKLVLFALATGRVTSLPRVGLFIGLPPPPTTPPTPTNVLLIPSVNTLTHKHRLHTARPGGDVLLATSPTPLESTSHVLVVGTDIFYTRASAGKPFDMLNDDFNFVGLVAVCAVLTAAAVILKVVSGRKALQLVWA